MHPLGIGQINIAPLRRLLRCAHSGRREINRFCTYVKLINGHSSRLSFQLPSAYLCAKDRQAINVPIVSACDFAPVSTVHIRVEQAQMRDEVLPIARI
jgi:hypothetical protein